MTENTLKLYEKLLGYILMAAVILGVISSLTGCGEYFKEDSRIIIDYRRAEGHMEVFSNTTPKGEPYYDYEYVPDKFELLWEITYQDGHKERAWKECTRFEYQNAKEELGG